MIKHYEKLSNTHAIPLLVEGWSALLRDGMTDGGVAIMWDHAAFVATEAGQPAGVLSYSKQDWSNTILIAIGYVAPQHRRKGIYRDLWHALIAKAQELKVSQIIGTTAMQNTAMREQAKSVGRFEQSVNLVYRMPIDDDGTSHDDQ